MTRPRLLILATSVALAAATLAACSSGHRAAGPVTLSFVSPEQDTQVTRQLIGEFEKADPGIRIRAVQAADPLSAARAGVDVAQIAWTEMPQAYQTLPIVPVERIAGGAWRATATGLNQAVLKATSYAGLTVAMPYTMSVPTLFYNAALFRSAGLDPASPPSTMDEVGADASAIVRHGGQGVYFDVADAARSDVMTQSLIDGEGGSVIAQNGVVTLDQPPAVRAMQAMANLTRSGAQPGVGESDAITAFEAGRLGMLVTSSERAPSLATAAKGKFTLLAGAFPGFGTQPARPTYDGSGLVVLTRVAARQQAAWQFVQFLTGEQSATTLTTKLGSLPLRPDVVTDPKYLGTYFKTDRLLLPALRQLNAVTPYAYFRGPNAGQAVVALQDDAVTPIAVQGQDARPIMKRVANTIRNLIG